MTLNPLHSTGLFQFLLKTLANLWFSHNFQEVYKKTSAVKWVKGIFKKYVNN